MRSSRVFSQRPVCPHSVVWHCSENGKHPSSTCRLCSRRCSAMTDSLHGCHADGCSMADATPCTGGGVAHGKRGSQTHASSPSVNGGGGRQHWRSAGLHMGPCSSMRDSWKLQSSMNTRQARARAASGGMVDGIAALCTQRSTSMAARCTASLIRKRLRFWCVWAQRTGPWPCCSAVNVTGPRVTAPS